MKVFKTVVSFLLAVTFGVTAIVGQSAHFDIAGMDTKTSACADFYQYANGGWLAANPIPAAYPAWGVANVLDEKNREALRQILEDAAKNTRQRRKGSRTNRRSAIITPPAWMKRKSKRTGSRRSRPSSI